MELFEEVFNPGSIYDMLFFNVKAVLEHPTLNKLEEHNSALHQRWKHISKIKHGFDINVRHFNSGGGIDETPEYAQKIYEENAIYHPEFCKIIAITYGKIYYEEGKKKRYLKKIINNDEYLLIDTFMDVLRQISSDAVNSSPQYFLTLCGHNITNYDIPMLLKRYLLYRDKFENDKKLPLLLKKCLSAKPWDSGIVDTVNVWKFNGNNYDTLMLISDYLQLKKTVSLEAMPEVSKEYWKQYEISPSDAQEYVALQSATQTNLVIQLMLELREAGLPPNQ